MKIIKIAISNIRKRKSNSITFFSMVILTTIVLSLSLTLFTGIGNFYKNKRQELNGPDFTMLVSEYVYKEEINEYIENYPELKEYNQQKSYLAGVTYDDVKTSFVILKESNNDIEIIDKLSIRPEKSIILPLNTKYEGYKSGQQFIFTSAGKNYEYTIYGFFEDIVLGGNFTSLKTIYLSDDSFKALENEQNFAVGEYFSVYFNKEGIDIKFEKEIISHFSLDSESIITVTAVMSEQSATMFVLIMSAILMLVAVIILIIALIVVRFNIVNTLSEDIKVLGSLKSLGFTSKQLILTIITQFGIISIIGSSLGLLISSFAFPYLANLVASTSGLTWTNSSSLLPFLLAILIINFLIIIISFISSNKIKKVTPVKAFRNEIGKSNGKNYLPLSDTPLPLDLNVGLKNALNNKKNNLISFFVVILFSFLTVLSYTLYHNFVIDNTAFKNMVGFETAEVVVSAYTEETSDLRFAEIAEDSRVIKTIRTATVSVKIDSAGYALTIWEDFSKKNISTVIEGRDPSNDFEVVIPKVLEKTLNKKIGDELTIYSNNTSFSYKISGTSQSIGDGSQNLTMSEAGYKHLNPNAKLKSLYVYLTPETDTQEYCNYLEISYGREITVFNIELMIQTTFDSIKSPIELITYLVIALTAFTIIFVFFLLINTLIRRYKKTIGIYKALGYTNFQIIKHILFTFTPTMFLGAILGLVIALSQVNFILGIFFASTGIKKAAFEIPLLPSTLLIIALFFLCVFVIFIISNKVRKITAHKLLIE